MICTAALYDLGIALEQYARLLTCDQALPGALRARVAQRLDLDIHAVSELILPLGNAGTNKLKAK